MAENPKAALLEAEIETCRQTKNFSGLEDKLAKFRKKYFPNGSALEFITKAEILLHPLWMSDDTYPYDCCPTRDWIPPVSVESKASLQEAVALLRKAQGDMTTGKTLSETTNVLVITSV